MSTLLGRSIDPLHFKTERVSQDRLTRYRDLKQLSLDLPKLGGHFPDLEDSKITPEGLSSSVTWTQVNGAQVQC